jgi:hypothetical protein
VGRDPPLGPHRRHELASWLSGIPVLPGDEAVATTWGRLSAETTLRGRPRPVNDMWIAQPGRLAGEPILKPLNRLRSTGSRGRYLLIAAQRWPVRQRQGAAPWTAAQRAGA